MRTVCALILFAVAGSAFAGDRLETYADLVAHLEAGGKVRAVVDLSKLRLRVDGVTAESPKMKTGFEFTTWQQVEKGVLQNVQAYVMLVSDFDQHLRGRGNVRHLVEARLDENGVFALRVRHLVTGSEPTLLLYDLPAGTAASTAVTFFAVEPGRKGS